MTYFLKRVLLVTSSSFFVFLFAFSFASAQTGIGLQLKPAIVEDQVNPGEDHQYSLSVTNISNTPGTFFVTARDIKGIDDQGRPVFSSTGEVTGFELTSWIALPSGTLSLNGGETKSISFSIHIPKDASPGSHFASVFFSDKPNSPTTSGTGVGFDVGSIVSLRISGDIQEEAVLREFSTKKLVYPDAQVDFSTRVENLGNVLVQPTGVIQITNMFGKDVATIPVNAAVASVFPKAERTYPATWDSSAFAFGRYQAIVSLSYGTDAKKTIYSTTSFWVLPLIPILIVFGVILAVVLTVYFLMRSYIRRKLRQMGVQNVSRTDATFYRNRYQKNSSRLIIVTMAILLAALVCIVLVFLFFA